MDINNKKNNIIKYQKINYSNKKINSLIIFLIFSIIIKECSLPFPDYHSSIITIKINKNGTHKIFDDSNYCWGDKFSLPDKVIINNETQENILPFINFEKTNNIIQLIWNEPRENWGCLFHTCIDIVEIDFHNLIFHKVLKEMRCYMIANQ